MAKQKNEIDFYIILYYKMIEPKENEKELILAIIAWVVAVGLIVVKHKKASLILNDIQNSTFMISLVIVIVFTAFCWHSNNEKLKLASQKASVALIISYLSHLDLIYACYFIVFIFAFYSNAEIV